MVNQGNNVPILNIPPVVANPINGLANTIDTVQPEQPKSVNPLINFANAAAGSAVGLAGSRVGLFDPAFGEVIQQFGQETFPSQPGTSQFLGSLVPTIAETAAAAVLPIPGTGVAKLAQLGLIGSNVAATAGDQRIKILRARRDNLQDIPFTDEFLATAGSGLITAFSEKLGFRFIEDNLSKVRRQDIIDLALASTYNDKKAAAEAFKRIASQAGSKSLPRVFGEQAFEEGFQESLEQFGLNAVEKFVYNPHLSLSEGLAESFIGGGIAGGAVLGLGVIYDRAKGVYNGSDPRISLEASIEERESLQPLYGFRIYNKDVSPFTTSEDMFDLFFSFEPEVPRNITNIKGTPTEKAAELYVRRIFDFRNPEHIRRFAKKVFSKDQRLVDDEGKSFLTDRELNQMVEAVVTFDMIDNTGENVDTLSETVKNIVYENYSTNDFFKQILISSMYDIIRTRQSQIHYIETGIYRESIVDLGFDSYLTYEGESDVEEGYGKLNIGVIDRSKVIFLDKRPNEDYIRNTYTTTRSSGELMARDDRQDFRVVSGSKPTEVGGFVVAYRRAGGSNEPIIGADIDVFRNIESANEHAKQKKGISIGFVPNKVLQKIDGFNNQFRRGIASKPEVKRNERLLTNTLSNKFKGLRFEPRSYMPTLEEVNTLLNNDQNATIDIDLGEFIPLVTFNISPISRKVLITIGEEIYLNSAFIRDMSVKNLYVNDLTQEDVDYLVDRTLESPVIHGFIDFQRSNIFAEINHPAFDDKSLDYRIARVNELIQLSFLRHTGYNVSPVGLNLDDAMQGKQVTPKNNGISFPLEFMQTGGKFPLAVARVKAAVQYLEDIAPNAMSKAGSIVIVPDSYINKLVGQDDTSNTRVNGLYASIMEGLDTNGLPDITPGAIFINSDSIDSVEKALRIIAHEVKHKLDENREDFKQLSRVFNDSILKRSIDREQAADAYATRITRKFVNDLHNNPTIVEFQSASTNDPFDAELIKKLSDIKGSMEKVKQGYSQLGDLAKYIDFTSDKGVKNILTNLVTSGALNKRELENVMVFLESINNKYFKDLSLQVLDQSVSRGQYEFLKNLITIYKGSVLGKNTALDSTVIHELWHSLERFISPKVYNQIKKDYIKASEEFLKQYPDLSKLFDREKLEFTHVFTEADLYKVPERLKDQVHYREKYNLYTLPHKIIPYRLTNLSEWIAESMTQTTYEYYNDISQSSKSVFAFLKYITKKLLDSISYRLGFINNRTILKTFQKGGFSLTPSRPLIYRVNNSLSQGYHEVEFQPKVGGKRVLAANELPKLQAFIQGTGLVDEIIISDEQLFGPKKDIDGNDILDEQGQIIVEAKNGLIEVDSVTGRTTIKLSPEVDQNTILHELVHAYLIHVGEYTGEMQMLLQTFDYDREAMIDGIADYIFGRLQPKGLFQAIGQRLYDFMVGARQIIGLADSRTHLLNIISKQIIKTKDGQQVRASEYNKNMQEKSYLNQQLKNLFRESSVDRLFELAKGINLELNNTSKTIHLRDIEKTAIELLGDRNRFEDLIFKFNSSDQPQLNSIEVVALDLFKMEKLKSLFFMNFNDPEKIKAWQNEILSSSIMNRNPASEAGRILAVHKHYAKVWNYAMQLIDQAKELTPETIIEFQNAVVRALDPRKQDLEELIRLHKLHTESPTIQNLLVEMYIGNLLSGPPSLMVNLFGNWTWQKYNINIHDKLATTVDKYLNDSALGRMLGKWGLFSKSREYFVEKQFQELLNEALIDGQVKGKDYAKRLLRGDITSELGDRYELEIGLAAVDAFRRFDSNNIPALKNLDKNTKEKVDKFMQGIAAPMVTAFPRILRATDAYFRGGAFEYNMAKVAIREVMNNRDGILRLMKKSKKLSQRQLDNLTKIAQERELLEQEKRILLRETETLSQLNSMLNDFKKVTTAELVTALRRDPLGMLGNVEGKRLQDEAAEISAQYLFMDKQKGFLRTLDALRNRFPLLGRLLVPIMNTPLNLLKRGIELTPLAGAIYGIPKAKRKIDRLKIEKTYDTWYRVYKRQEALRKRIDKLNEEGKDSTKANSELNKLLRSIGLKPGELINQGQIKSLRKMRANSRRLSTGRGEDTIQNIIAKQLEGTFLALIFIMLFDRDEITGPVPKDPNQRDAFYRQGKTPWSFRVGDTWVSYRNMEPFNTPIAAASSAWQWFNDTDAEPGDYTVEKFVGGISDYIAKSTWIANMSPFVTGRGLQNTLYNIPANFVPYSSLQRSINNMIEVVFEGGRVIKEREDLTDAFSPVIIKPVASLLGITSEPRQNVWGQDIKVPEDFLQQWLPFSWTEQTKDYVELELERISMYPGVPKQEITYRGREIELPDDVYRQYVMNTGRLMKQEIRKVMTSGQYLRLTHPEDRHKLLESASQRARSKSREELEQRLKGDLRILQLVNQ